MSVTSNYAIGHNLAGYLPESDVIVVSEWSEAVDILTEEMKFYADADDDAAWDQLYSLPESVLIADYNAIVDNGHVTEVDFGDDTPSMLATVQSILADEFDTLKNAEGYRFIPPLGITFTIEDNDGRMIAFWIQRTDEPVTDED